VYTKFELNIKRANKMKKHEMGPAGLNFLDKLSNQEIEGSKVLGGGSNMGSSGIIGSNIEPNLIAPGMDAVGYDSVVIAVGDAQFGVGSDFAGSEAPPINNGNNFTINSGYTNGSV